MVYSIAGSGGKAKLKGYLFPFGKSVGLYLAVVNGGKNGTICKISYSAFTMFIGFIKRSYLVIIFCSFCKKRHNLLLHTLRVVGCMLRALFVFLPHSKVFQGFFCDKTITCIPSKQPK